MKPGRGILEGTRGPLSWAVGSIGGAALGAAVFHGWAGAAVGFLVGGLVGLFG